MKKYLGMWIVLLFVSSGFAEDPKSDQEKAVRQVLDDQVTAWNKGDLESFMKGYWDSEKLTFYSGKLKFAGLEITKLGDGVMLVKGEWEVQMTKEKVNGLFTLIMKETKSGWKIIHDHTS